MNALGRVTLLAMVVFSSIFLPMVVVAQMVTAADAGVAAAGTALDPQTLGAAGALLATFFVGFSKRFGGERFKTLRPVLQPVLSPVLKAAMRMLDGPEKPQQRPPGGASSALLAGLGLAVAAAAPAPVWADEGPQVAKCGGGECGVYFFSVSWPEPGLRVGDPGGFVAFDFGVGLQGVSSAAEATYLGGLCLIPKVKDTPFLCDGVSVGFGD